MAENIFSHRSNAPTNSPYRTASDELEPVALAETRAEIEAAQKTLKARQYLATTVERSEADKQRIEELERREQLLKWALTEEGQRELRNNRAQETEAAAQEKPIAPTRRGPPLAALFAHNLALAIRNAASIVLHTSEEHAAETEKINEEEHRAHESRQKHKLLVGAQNKSLARYWLEHELKHRFQATMGWYMSEAHHDETGADPSMISMFLIAFLARAIYSNALEAILLVVLLGIFTAFVWFVSRACFPVAARYMDRTESLLLAFVYDIFAFAAGIFVASYTLALWPGLLSYADACGETNSNSVLWVDCTNGRTFVIMAYLFIFAILGVFSSVYKITILALLLTTPFMIMLGFHTNEPLDVFYTFTFASASMAYFYATFARPIRGSYAWNLLLGISWYLFAVSVLIGFGF